VHGQRRERTRLITGPIVLEKGERSRHLHIAGEQQEGPARTAIARHGVGSHTSAPVRSPRTAGEPRPALNDREAECLPAANVEAVIAPCSGLWIAGRTSWMNWASLYLSQRTARPFYLHILHGPVPQLHSFSMTS
jgi:hypothetical protein